MRKSWNSESIWNSARTQLKKVKYGFFKSVYKRHLHQISRRVREQFFEMFSHVESDLFRDLDRLHPPTWENLRVWKTVVDSLVVLSRSGLFGIRTLKQWIAAAAAAKCSLKAKPLLGKTYLLSFPSYHMKCVVSWSLNNDFSSISQEHKFSTYGFTDDVWHHSLNMRCKIWKPCSLHALFEKH